MTTLNIANQIPATIDTLEKINVWSGLALSNINPQLTAVEGVGTNERTAQAGVFYVPASNLYRVLVRTSIVISPDYLAGGSKLWTYVQPLSNTAMPTIFTV